jgi:hypothetical protein
MRTNGLYDATRGLTLALAAGVAGLLLYLATRVGETTTGRFWESMGIVAAAGLVLALAHVLGSWTKGLRLRLSPSTFLLAFLPVLVCVGWVLLATQPGHGWHEGTLVSWSNSLGVMDVAHDLGLWHGVLAFGFGLLLGMSFDTVPVLERGPVAVAAPAAGTAPMDPAVADDPVTAEREAALAAEERTAAVGPTAQRERVTPAGQRVPERSE